MNPRCFLMSLAHWKNNGRYSYLTLDSVLVLELS